LLETTTQHEWDFTHASTPNVTPPKHDFVRVCARALRRCFCQRRLEIPKDT
jgi:hypothetical protein